MLAVHLLHDTVLNRTVSVNRPIKVVPAWQNSLIMHAFDCIYWSVGTLSHFKQLIFCIQEYNDYVWKHEEFVTEFRISHFCKRCCTQKAMQQFISV